MILVIRGHPRRRMAERLVTEADIEHALCNHEMSWPAHDGGIAYQGPGMTGRSLKVWVLAPGYTGEDATVTVKSVAWKDEEEA